MYAGLQEIYCDYDSCYDHGTTGIGAKIEAVGEVVAGIMNLRVSILFLSCDGTKKSGLEAVEEAFDGNDRVCLDKTLVHFGNMKDISDQDVKGEAELDGVIESDGNFGVPFQREAVVFSACFGMNCKAHYH